jgi:hypothetical protein
LSSSVVAGRVPYLEPSRTNQERVKPPRTYARDSKVEKTAGCYEFERGLSVPMLMRKSLRLAALVIVLSLGSACGPNPSLQTKLTCTSGEAVALPEPATFVMTDEHKTSRSTALKLSDPGNASAVCDQMSEAAVKIGFKVERLSPTTLMITGTDRLSIVFFGVSHALTESESIRN